MAAIPADLPLQSGNSRAGSVPAPTRVVSWLMVGALWLYALIIALWLAAGWGGAAVVEWIGAWHPLLSLVLALSLIFPVIRELKPGFRRTGWQFVFWATFSDVLANCWWAYLDADPTRHDSGWNDLPYMVYYPLAAAAFAMFYRDLGGSFRRRQVWLDVITLALGLGAVLWLFLLEPQLRINPDRDANFISLLGLAVGDGVLLILVSLLVMQVSEWKAERALLLLIAATVASFTTDLDWIGVDGDHKYLYNVWSDLGGYGLYYALLGTAAVLERFHHRPAEITLVENNRYSFLPILSVLLAIGMLCGYGIELRDDEGISLLAFVLVGAMLVATRQQGVRTEIHRMHDTIVRREARSHLTELIRRSADLIAVADACGQLSFVSPAAEALLGKTAENLQSQPAARLLGAEHEARLRDFLGEVRQQHAVRAEIELVVAAADGAPRTLHVLGSDQLGNEAIGGIVLTICDITERRRLEREVLEIAVHERERLANDIRDGLGLELDGIKGSVSRLNGVCGQSPGAPDCNVDGVIAQVNRSIDLARRLAVSLSPLHVARGSLEIAIGQLAKETTRRFAVKVKFQHDNGQFIAATEADHLYRIAQDVLDCAARSGNCRRIQIDLYGAGDRFLLSISGDGWVAAPGAAEAEQGLRMAEYRARLIGGTLRRERTPRGTCVEVSVPFKV